VITDVRAAPAMPTDDVPERSILPVGSLPSVVCVLAVLVAASCGGRARDGAGDTGTHASDAGPAGSDTSGSATTTAVGTSTAGNDLGSTTGAGIGDCSEYVGVVTPEQAAMTPRPNLGAEGLAHAFTDDVVVSDEVYARAVEDREVLERLGYLACLHGTPDLSKILLSFVEHHDEALEGTYEPWVCANELYGAGPGPVEVSPMVGRGDPIVLYLSGMFDVDQISADYQGMPGVDAVETIVRDCLSDLALPAPIEALYGCAEGDSWHYWWTDAYVGQDGFPITSVVHLASEPGAAPVQVCTWSEGGPPCEPPACIAEILAPLRG
jgi:hypothetical protein